MESVLLRLKELNLYDDNTIDFYKVFEWFRKTHNLIVSNPPTIMNNIVYFKSNIYKYKPIRLGNTIDILYSKTYETYEEAEFESLKKLIELTF